jgi:hypothetical protein
MLPETRRPVAWYWPNGTSQVQLACYTKLQFDRPAHAWPQHTVLLAKPAIKCIR